MRTNDKSTSQGVRKHQSQGIPVHTESAQNSAEHTEVPGEGCHLAPPSPRRLEKEIEVLENTDVPPATIKENVATPSPAKEAQKAEVVLNFHQVRVSPGPHPSCGQILVQKPFHSNPSLPLPSCVTWDIWLCLSGPPFPHWKEHLRVGDVSRAKWIHG